MAEDAGDKGASMNPEEARSGQGGPWLLQGEKATALPNQREAMLAGRLRFVTATSDKGADDLQRDHWVIVRQPLGQKPIKDAERPRLVSIVIAGGTLAIKKPVEGGCQR
jgi:hypothetical protein